MAKTRRKKSFVLSKGEPLGLGEVTVRYCGVIDGGAEFTSIALHVLSSWGGCQYFHCLSKLEGEIHWTAKPFIVYGLNGDQYELTFIEVHDNWIRLFWVKTVGFAGAPIQ